jgi:hypothetical protein
VDSFYPNSASAAFVVVEVDGEELRLLLNFHIAHLRNGIQGMLNGKNWAK